jgi:hypothetical protein
MTANSELILRPISTCLEDSVPAGGLSQLALDGGG